MNVFETIKRWHRLLHRYTSYRTEVGLRRIGNPGPDAPVLVTGNYEQTVDRLAQILAGHDCWLLVADSAGINVWCAAGVGDFDENKIVDVVVATKLSEMVKTRVLILPPLAAVGIDRKKLTTMTGFGSVWGPAHYDDLPEFLRNFPKRTEAMRLARFPMRDRLEMGVGMMAVFSFPLLLAVWRPRQVFWFLGSIFHAIFGSLVGYDLLPQRTPANKTIFIGFIQTIFLVVTRRHACWKLPLWERLTLGWLAHGLIAVDMIGSTPFYKTTIGQWLTTGTHHSLFQPALNDNCTACGACIEVCPKGLFSRGVGKAGTFSIDLSKECCEWLACVRQCPHRAIDNMGVGFKDDIRSLPDELLPGNPHKLDS